MNTLLTLILLSNIALLIVLVVFVCSISSKFSHYRREIQDFIQNARETYEDFIKNARETYEDYVTPQDGKPSKFEVQVSSIAQAIGRAAAMEIKTTLMGKASGAARAETAVQGALIEDLVEQQHPMLGGFMSLFPKAGKKIAQNPSLLNALMSFMSRGQQNLPPGGNHHSESPKFKL